MTTTAYIGIGSNIGNRAEYINKALALLEYKSVAIGLLAVDRMVKNSPVELLQCGSVHPGNYLILVRGTPAATQAAHQIGIQVGKDNNTLVDEVCLLDPPKALTDGIPGKGTRPDGETVGVLEVATSPGLLRWLDAALKAIPITVATVDLADDLAGKAVAIISGDLADVQEAITMADSLLGSTCELLAASVISNADLTLRQAVESHTRFSLGTSVDVDGAELVEE